MTADQIIIRILEISLCLYLVRRIQSWWGKKSLIEKIEPFEPKEEHSKKVPRLFYKKFNNRKAFSTKQKNIDIATESREHFFQFVKKCNELYRSGHDLLLYREIIDSHRKFGNLINLIEDDIFLGKLHQTLNKFNMNQKGARMVALDVFKRSVRFWKDNLVNLYEYKLFELSDVDIMKIKTDLEKVFINLNVMESKRRIVGVSKALHFLLPDLIMPIDGKYTLPAIYGYNKYSNSPEKEFIIFKEIFNRSLEITRNLQLNSSDVDGEKWNTSVPKLIDNAIIGLVKSEEEEVRSLFK